MSKTPKDIIPSVGILNLPVPPSWKASDQLNAYESWAYTAINAIAHEVASIEWKLYKKLYTKDSVNYEEIYEHEALSLLSEVNPYSNGYTHFFETVVYLELLGEAYWAIMRDAQDRPVSMWQLRPDHVTIVPSQSKLIDHYLYRVGNDEYKLRTEDVVPFRFLNPTQPYRGKSPIQSAAMAIDTDRFSADWNRNFFYNSALPNMIISTDQNLSKDVVDRLVSAWTKRFQGKENAHKVAFMTAGFKPTEIGQKIKDMDFIEQRRAMRDEILGIFKVPKTVLGLTEEVNRANAEATTLAFMERTVTPIVKMLASYLNEFYLRLWGEDSNLFFDFTDPSPEDVETDLKIYESGLKYGWLTINEVRERENLDPVEGGDNIYLPFGMTRLEDKEDQPKPSTDNPFAPQEGEDEDEEKPEEEEPKKVIALPVIKSGRKTSKKFNMPIPPKRLAQLRQESIEKEIDRDLIKLVQLAMQLKVTKTDEDKKEIFKEKYWKQMVAKTDVQEATMADNLKTLFSNQEQEVLSKVANSKGYKKMTKKAAQQLLFDLDVWDEEFRKIFAKFIRSVVEERALEVFGMVGTRGGFDLTTETAIKFLNVEGLKFIKQVNETTRDKLLDQLRDGLRAGEGIDDLSNRVKSVYSEANDSRAAKIARTEVLRATNFATLEAYKQSDVVAKQEWLTALDERTCDACNALDGKQVELDKSFHSAEFGNVEHPPLHPQCRCTIMPVLEGTRAVKPKKRITVAGVNKAIERRVLILERLTSNIDQLNKEIDEAKLQAQVIKDEALKDAEVQKQEILKAVRKQAEANKEEALKDLKDLRDRAKRMEEETKREREAMIGELKDLRDKVKDKINE